MPSQGERLPLYSTKKESRRVLMGHHRHEILSFTKVKKIGSILPTLKARINNLADTNKQNTKDAFLKINSVEGIRKSDKIFLIG